jgi:hypothetical protein
VLGGIALVALEKKSRALGFLPPDEGGYAAAPSLRRGMSRIFLIIR